MTAIEIPVTSRPQGEDRVGGGERSARGHRSASEDARRPEPYTCRRRNRRCYQSREGVARGTRDRRARGLRPLSGGGIGPSSPGTEGRLGARVTAFRERYLLWSTTSSGRARSNARPRLREAYRNAETRVECVFLALEPYGSGLGRRTTTRSATRALDLRDDVDAAAQTYGAGATGTRDEGSPWASGCARSSPGRPSSTSCESMTCVLNTSSPVPHNNAGSTTANSACFQKTKSPRRAMAGTGTPRSAEVRDLMAEKELTR